MKWGIFGYLLIFVILLIAILWVFQTVYLDFFYRSIRASELKKAMNRIEKQMEDSVYKEGLEQIATEYDIRILMALKDGTKLYETGSVATQQVSKMDTEQMKDLYRMAEEKNGEVQISSRVGLVQEKKNQEDAGMHALPPQNRGDYQEMFEIPQDSHMETMIIAKIVTAENGGSYLMIADSMLTPVTATVSTLRVQLVYISFFMIALSLVMALFLSAHISRPMTKINKTAKEISKGNLHIEFQTEDGYRELREMGETLNYTVDELTKSERIQRELIANVSHDLRTPLTMITAYSEVMRDIPGENTPENVQVIIDEANRLTELVNDLLDISKLQAGVLKPELKKYNLTKGIEKVLKRYARLKEQDGYDISFQKDGFEIWVKADEFKIYQVIYNLVNNAINYTGADKKVVVRQITAGNIVRIEVRDTGEGITEEEQKNVWERYYKVDKTHKRAVMGTGLGLSIVKNVLELHKARYGVESVKGQGSTFWFELVITEKRQIPFT